VDLSLQEVLSGLVALLVTTGLAIQQTRKAQREAEEHRKSEWNGIIALQQQHIDALENRIESMQAELIRDRETLALIRHQSERWSQRNADLEDQLQEARAKLKRLGHDPGPPPLGEG
jgi:hypothetical protein